MTKLTCYQLTPDAPRLVPARSERAWMDATRMRYAYRCLPLTIANSMGWELLMPWAVSAEWNGGPELADIAIDGVAAGDHTSFALSHFGHGILTFQTGYLFRTDPGIALWVRGAPNLPKDGIAPLDGIVETDWMSFGFTMNWMFTRPGRVRFEAGEPFCFITPIGYHALDAVVPEVTPIGEHPEMAAAYQSYAERRQSFNDRLAVSDPETVRQGWQKWYMRGVSPDGTERNPHHISKLRLAEPRNMVANGAEPALADRDPDATPPRNAGG
ncbi:MAG: hypothetical protein IT535_06025 [Bauldia sp.]|nr:hypothetical protein [Bauldia sp.]